MKPIFNSGHSTHEGSNQATTKVNKRPARQPLDKEDFRPKSLLGRNFLIKSTLNLGTITCFPALGNQTNFSKAQSLNYPKAHSWESVRKSRSEERNNAPQLETRPEVFCKERVAGYRRGVRPKQSSDFIRGEICRWEPQEVTSSLSNSVINQKSAFNGKHENFGKGISLEKKPLKVYSRGKVRRNPISMGKLERFSALLEEDKEDLDTELDEDNPLLRRPDLSSNSSSSESEEVFHSDSATEEDQDAELEGFSTLFGIDDHLVEKDQNTSVQEDRNEPLQSLSTVKEISSVQKG